MTRSLRPLIGHARANHWCWKCRTQKPREQFRQPVREGDRCRDCRTEAEHMAKANRNKARKARRKRAKARATVANLDRCTPATTEQKAAENKERPVGR